MRLCCWNEAVEDLQLALSMEQSNENINAMLKESRREAKRLEELENYKKKASSSSTMKRIQVVEEDDDEEEEIAPKEKAKDKPKEWWEQVKDLPSVSSETKKEEHDMS